MDWSRRTSYRPPPESPLDDEPTQPESNASQPRGERFGCLSHVDARPIGKTNIDQSQEKTFRETDSLVYMATAHDDDDDVQARVMTPAASEAIQDKMRELGWVNSKGSVEWSKLQVALREKRSVNASRQLIMQQIKNIGGKSVLVRDMLKALELPLSLLHDLEDGERLLLLAAHDEGFSSLSPEQQLEVEKELRTQIKLRVLAAAQRNR